MLKMMNVLVGTASAALLFGASTSQAATIGFVEDFDTDVAGWEDNVNHPIGFVASGGVDGGSYATTTFNYNGFASPFGGGPVTHRGSFSDNASGGAFVGDYLAEGVGAIKISFRHNAPEAINLFLRVATSVNFPGAVVNQALDVPANQWTELTFAIEPFSPACTGEAVPCAAAFSNVQNIQFGTNAPAGLLDDDVAYSLDIDRITIVPIPEPGTALLMGLGLLGLTAAGRKKEVA